MTEREFATFVSTCLQSAGFRALWAGGCVRDELLGLSPADYDIATDARPEQVAALFRRTIAVGASFGVIEVLGPRDGDGEWLKVQVATFRSDGNYSDGRRPDSVTFSSPEEDAARRDFTVNGLFYDPITGEVLDFVGGRADLDARILRAIGDPAARFREDKLRLLRAVRIATRFDLAIDPRTLAAAKAMAAEIRVVSAERIADELRKLLAHPRRGRGVELLREIELNAPLLPEVSPWEPAVRVVAALGESVGFPLAFAALLNVAPPKIVAGVCKRLRLSNDETGRVGYLVEHRAALVGAEGFWPSRLYPILVHPGIADLLALHRAIATAEGTPADHVEFCERVLREVPRQRLDPPPLVTGDDLRAAGWKPGPAFKRALDAVRAAQLDGELTTADQAMDLATTFLAP